MKGVLIVAVLVLLGCGSSHKPPSLTVAPYGFKGPSAINSTGDEPLNMTVNQLIHAADQGDVWLCVNGQCKAFIHAVKRTQND